MTAIKHKIISMGAAIFGSLFVVFAIVSLNRILLDPHQDQKTAVTRFEIAKHKPKQQQRVTSEPKKAPKTAPKNLYPNLDSLLAGSSFGLEAFQWLDQDALGSNLLMEMKDAAMTADTVEQAPVVLHTAPLDYPNLARKQGIKGFVTVNLLVAPNGSVEKTQIVASEPEGVFDSVATSSVKQWKFQPGVNKGQRVAVWVEQTIKFALN